eukprot:scaffold118650_cov62-Phaeocystis_antarctica.AAC.3
MNSGESTDGTPDQHAPKQLLLSETEIAARRRGYHGGGSLSLGARHPVIAVSSHSLVAQPGGDLVDPLLVRRVQVVVVLLARVDVQPAHRRRVIARVEVKVGAELGVACAVGKMGRR